MSLSITCILSRLFKPHILRTDNADNDKLKGPICRPVLAAGYGKMCHLIIAAATTKTVVVKQTRTEC